MDPAEQGRLLAAARRTGEKLSDYPGDKPAGLSEAYIVQEEMAAALAMPRIGWKVGCTAEAGRVALGIDAPVYGPLFAPLVAESPARLPATADDLRIPEPEIAFRMGADLPHGAVTPEALREAIATVHPVIELVSKRLPGGPVDAAEWVVADGALNAGLALGAGMPFAEGQDFLAEEVTLIIDGTEVSRGIGANVDTGPLGVALWLAQALDARGMGLRKGDIVSTGVISDVKLAEPGQEVVARFSTLGEVRLTLV